MLSMTYLHFYYNSNRMLLVLSITLLTIVNGKGISEANIQRLRSTPQMNFTYYYYHEYPVADIYEVALTFDNKGGNIPQSFSKLKLVDSIIREAAGKCNGTVVGNSKDVLSSYIDLIFEEDTTISASLSVLLTDQGNLVNFLEQIAKQKDIIIVGVDRVRSQQLNFELQDEKAKENAIKKNEQICKQYFGMEYQQMLVFQKVTNATSINQTEQIKGSYVDVLMEVDEVQQQLLNVQDAFYKCQIICRNPNHSTGRQKETSKSSKTKNIDAKIAEKIVNTKSAKKNEKPLKKEVQGKSKKKLNDEL